MSEVRIPVKLFVGKLPCDWDEEEVRSLFGPYGDVEEVSIIRPKTNPGKGQKYGCAFVKYGAIQEAAAAIQGMAGKQTVNENAGPLQIQYANGEPERLGLADDTEGVAQKLFVANVPADVDDAELKRVFSQYGTVTEAYCIQPRRPGGNRAAFVRFSKKSDGLRAIDALNEKFTFPNNDRPVAVKCAETREQRDAHRQDMDVPRSQQQQPSNRFSNDSGYGPGPTSTGGYGQRITPVPTAAAQPRQAGDWTEYLSQSDGRYYYHNSRTGQTQWDVPYEFQSMGPPPTAVPPQQDHSYGGGYGLMQTPRSQQQRRDGPMGANVFVYNIPPEWTDNDLVREFGSCGPLSTTRVIIDSQTNQSKGYGFVSFREVRSAMKAVETMDGFLTSTGRRLKVQIKKGEEEAAAQALGIPVSQVKANADRGSSGNRATPY
ncbi:Heterogeneous nuclear ribonucleoprotein 27C, putative [Perkinsus marinus ATCC 50983]|uniref:Heterogeneous nuclear ribonucleoprotein 27C, putative n=2 Tax=Perkinsus marinus (strain ATCC 50983 / TXsc) TaxID=423536 RepID=C5KF70_PERM5|nr:Heterogeneous nuclear ribonucleoprotein 27C, putative [Perkinsus marinus ATCC 50983]EER16872.1 Heterogeneous nuclear ribonucleoprotein 27C, putative [Perkinsus marinus ATCC 50983]|eukprot:XP_002785076.1 Heterogeneous nuclear ribonucleoprotein 27C, putative [Perkinsus marinus ATCC 50983]